MKFDKLRQGLIDILNSFNLTYELYKENGSTTSNPFVARYIFVEDPNMMFIVDDDNSEVEFHKSDIDFSFFKKILKPIRNLTLKYFVTLEVSSYNKVITPKTFSNDVMYRKHNKKKQLEIKESKNNSLFLIESYGDIKVYVDRINKKIVLENDKNKVSVNGNLYAYVPHLVQKLHENRLSSEYVNKIAYLHNCNKILKEEATRTLLNKNKKDLLKKSTILIKKIT